VLYRLSPLHLSHQHSVIVPYSKPFAVITLDNNDHADMVARLDAGRRQVRQADITDADESKQVGRVAISALELAHLA
jgi:hypothetical protein